MRGYRQSKKWRYFLVTYPDEQFIKEFANLSEAIEHARQNGLWPYGVAFMVHRQLRDPYAAAIAGGWPFIYIDEPSILAALRESAPLTS